MDSRHSSEGSPRQTAGHPDKDAGTLHSHQPSFAKASEGSPRHRSSWQATGLSGEGEQYRVKGHAGQDANAIS